MQFRCKLAVWLGVYFQLSQDIQVCLACFCHMESLKPFLQNMESIPLAVERMDPLLMLFVSANSHILAKMDPVFLVEPSLLPTPMPNHYFATYLVQLTP